MKNYSFTIFLVVILFAACSSSGDKNTNASVSGFAESKNEFTVSPEQNKVLGIQLGGITMRSLSGTIKANGMLDVPPQNLVTISAPLGGFIKKTSLLQGMWVYKGQLIAEMEHPDYIQLQQDYLESKSLLEFQELEYNRQSELAKDNVNAAKALQLAKSNFQGTHAKVEGLKARLGLVNINVSDIEGGSIKKTVSIYSPINGFVSQVNVNIGMHVNASQVMFRIVDTEHVHAEAQVFEKDIFKLKIGQLVRVRLTNEEKERGANVFLIGKEITAERTVRVHCHFIDHDPNLIPGMYFSAIIETGDKTVSSLPNEAIVNFNGKNYIFILKDTSIHHYKMIEVIAGLSEDGYTEVTVPVNIDDKNSIVIKGTYGLLSILKNTEE